MNSIIGIGTDVVQVPRIEKIYAKFGERFLHKNYHELEIKIFFGLPQKQRTLFLAKRFAAKEAISKALGFGIGKLGFKDIAIINNECGAPFVHISSKPGAAPGNYDDYKIHISLSDDYPIALAFAVVCCNKVQTE